MSCAIFSPLRFSECWVMRSKSDESAQERVGSARAAAYACIVYAGTATKTRASTSAARASY